MTPRYAGVEIIDILLVEDNAADVRLTEEVLKECKVVNRLHVVRDGAGVLPLLRGEPPHTEPYRPHLILLDLNLPKKHGREVLAEIKSDPCLQAIPVIVLTTSDSERDIVESYARFANAYVTKPLGLEQFVKVVQTIEEFWLSIVRLPPTNER